ETCTRKLGFYPLIIIHLIMTLQLVIIMLATPNNDVINDTIPFRHDSFPNASIAYRTIYIYIYIYIYIDQDALRSHAINIQSDVLLWHVWAGEGVWKIIENILFTTF
ncbi:hypothetical protein ACJX0J_011696, partial [Zea mays]